MLQNVGQRSGGRHAAECETEFWWKYTVECGTVLVGGILQNGQSSGGRPTAECRTEFWWKYTVKCRTEFWLEACCRMYRVLVEGIL